MMGVKAGWVVGVLVAVGASCLGAERLPYAIVDTGPNRCFDDTREIAYPRPGQAFYGQDAQYVGNSARYGGGRWL